MAQAVRPPTSTNTTVLIVRELSPSFVQLLNDPNPSLIRKSLECLRNFSQSPTDDEVNIIRSFKYLKDKIQQGGDTDNDASLISLIVFTLIIPCYRVYSNHDIYGLHFFQLLDLVLSHPSVSNDEIHRFSIAVIISRTSLYPPKSALITIDKWTTQLWLGKLIGHNSTANKMRYQSGKPFPFAPDSQICNLLCDNTKYPIDITSQFDSLIEKAQNHQQTNADELIALQNILNHLFDCQFILQAFLNGDQCLSLMLSFAVQRQRIVDVEIIDRHNLQAQTQLASIKNEMVNQFDYLPNANNRNFIFIQSECKIKWTDGKEFSYPSNIIHSRPSFLAPLAKLFQYAYVQQQEDNDTDAKGLWSLLLQTIHRVFTKYLETSTLNSELIQADLKDFFLYFLNHNNQQIRQTGTKLVTIFIQNLFESTEIELPSLISCSVIKNLFQSMIDNEKFPINDILLNGCLQVSPNWSIDDICLLLTSLAMKLSEISSSSSHSDSFDRRQIWFQFFVNIINTNLTRLTTSSIKTNSNFIEFCRQTQTSLFIQLLQPTIENSFQILKFFIKNCEKDWIKVLLEIIDQKSQSDQLQPNFDKLLKDSRQYAFDQWHIATSLNLLISLIKCNQDKNPLLLVEFLLLFEKTFDGQSRHKSCLTTIDTPTTIQSITNVLHQVFLTEQKDQSVWNSMFRRRLLSCATSIILHLINQINTTKLTIDMQRIIQSTILLSINYKQILRLFNFALRSQQHSVIEYWFKQLLTIASLTNDNCNEEEPLDSTSSDEEHISMTIDLFGIFTDELIQLLHEKFDQAINLISLPTFSFLARFIQQSLPICIQCLLHKNSNIRVSIARLIGRALNMQSDDLTKLLQSLKDDDSQDLHTAIATTINLINDQQRTVTQVESIPIYLLEREKKRSKSEVPFRVIKRTDFQELVTHLETSTQSVDENSRNESNNLDTIKHLISTCPEEFQHLIPNRQTLPSLVQTQTMLNNRKRIIECIRTPIHLLLQGETGVGKSSLILDVAADLKKPLIRFNLSSKTDIGGLFGSVKLKTMKSSKENQQEIELDYEEGPFTTAYRHGHWLLLDEMNLAPPNVLQAIEQALESGVLILPNIEDDEQQQQQNQTKQNYRVYQMHSEFRLFATQNPSIGQYKGARDAQSTALLNRFSIFIVEGPKHDELADIVTNKLRNEKFPFETQVKQMVNLHLEIMNRIQDNDFKERNRNYAEITIRELFRWCQSLCDYEKMLKKMSETVKNLDAQAFNRMISEQAYAIYGLRYRERQSQMQIASIIENLFHFSPLSTSKLTIAYRGTNTINFLSQKRLLLQMPTITLERVINDWPSHISKPGYNQEIERIIKFHNHFFKYLHSGSITHIYDCSYTLFWSILERRFTHDMTPLPELLVEIYTSLCRNENQREAIVKYISAEFREPESYLSNSVSSLSSARASFYLDEEANRVAQFILAASPSQPILIVGPEGCGKSHLVQAIATLTNVRCQHLYLTPQTEPAALVGSLVPHPKLPKWQDGAVSEAITKGHWLILENFSEASSAVLERLNPVLEQPPQWVKVENNETEPLKVSPNFRIIATMSPPTGRLQNASIETNHELSPALYNRFLIINYQGLDLSSLDVYNNVFSSYFPTNEIQLVSYLCDQIKSEPITPRQLVQFIDCAFKLQYSNVIAALRLDLPSVLLSAYELVFNIESTITANIKKYLETQATYGPINFFDLSVPIAVRETHREHIIDPVSTPTRYEAAKRLCASIICSRPVLLEGPAATGKTSLIEYLAQCSGKILYRVNNTKGTTVQDYFGSYMPNGEFLYGALSRAMSDGHWFVADEFDLAEPAVMNVLYPILEGQQYLTVPNTGQTLIARDGFRFFATQNGTSYVGRKQLPKTLRSRFLEIEFKSFTEKELEFIITQRKSTSTALTSSSSQAMFSDNLKRVAPQIASAVTILNQYIQEKQRPLFGAPKLGLTMREVIKWINRKQKKSDVDWEQHALRLLESRVPKKFSDEFIKCLCNERAFPKLKVPSCRVKIENNQISLHCPPNLPISYSFTDTKLAADLELSNEPQNFLLSLWRIFAAVDQHEPILLLGPTCYKSYLIKIWSKLMAKESDLCTITCSTSTETNDLIGSIRPYTHADALSLLLSCLNQFCERVKKNLSTSATPTDYNNFDEFCQNIKTFADDIDAFVRKIKEQQQQKIRQRRTKIVNQLASDLPEKPKLKTQTSQTDASKKPEFVRLPSIDSIPKPSPSSVTAKPINSDDDADFEVIYSSEQVFDIMMNDLNGMEEIDPFATGTDQQEEIDPFNMPEDNVNSANYDTTAIVTMNTEQQDEIDQFAMEQSQELSDEENILAFFNGAQLGYQATTPTSTLSLDKTTNPVLQAFQSVDNKLEIIVERLNYICRLASNENGVVLIKIRCESITNEIRRAIKQGKSNIFLFQDGPVTSAIKEGKILILEDINEPSQAVIERLNSLFETEPSFILYEDFTAQESTPTTNTNPQRAKIPLLTTFQVFATVHTDEITESRLQLSAATRSRMTEIRVQSYDTNELKQLTIKPKDSSIDDKHIESKMNPIIDILADQLAPLLAQTMKIDSLDSRHFVRFGECLRLHLEHMPIEQAAAICVKFLFLDSLNESKKAIMQKANTVWQQVLDAFKCINDTITKDEKLEKAGVYTRLDEWCAIEEMTIFDPETKRSREHWGLRLLSNQLIAPFAPQIKTRPEQLIFPLALTKSVLNNISRIIFSLHSSNRQLLAGPPGVGKTKIIEVLAKMLGYNVVRINFSSNTTFEDLIGSFVPRVVNGQRSFEFQEGPLYNSLNENRRNTVILFDELNLARKELLNQLMPLFANENQLFIPALAKSIPIDGSIIVAAMNPASIGGGREKLPRSTQTHFIQVQLAAFEVHELMYITISLLRPHLDASYLTSSLVEKINQFHYEISEKARLRQIGRLGGPYDFNLRDIEKLSNLIAAHSVTHRAHMNLSEETTPMNKEDDNNLSKIEEQNIIRSLHVYLDIVYACRFEYVQDQNLVREMIRNHFKLDISTSIDNRQELIDSDLNLQGYTRLGFVYIEKKEYQSTYRPLVHSQRTLEKLQLLAAATVSKATVLIEGGDCSGKTATVCELARLCGRRLLVLNLNHETTTSDLLGSWTVINKNSYEKRRKQASQQLLNDIVRFALAVLIPLSQQFYEAEKLIRTVTRLIHQWEHEMSDKAQNAFQQCRLFLENELERTTQVHVDSIAEEIGKYLDTLDQVEDEYRLVQNLGEGLTFTFNKGPLIQAMERGDWILLDNINCARGDVIERLNSLAEAEPTLTLYESATSQQYRRGNGIHKDFRLFVIANNNRKMANKLSSAWRNRCLIIRMQALDDELTVDNVEQHDLAEIIKGELQGINGGQELTHTLLRVHASAKQLSAEKELQFITSYQLSYQNVKRSARILHTYVSNRHDPVFSLKPAIFRSYLDPILNNNGKISLIKALIQHLANVELKKTSFSTLPILTSMMAIEDRHKLMTWYRPSQNLRDLMASIEECTIDLHLKMVNHHIKDDTSRRQEFLDYGLFLLDYLQPLLKSKQESESADELYSQASYIRSKILSNDNQQSTSVGFDLKKWLSKTHRYLQSDKILLSLDNIEDSLNLLDVTIKECYNQILEFVEQTSFIDAEYRLGELQQLSNTIHQLSSLSKKLHFVCKLSRSSNILDWSVQIQECLNKLLITETYMKWVAFPCQPMAKNDLHILLQTQEFIRQRNQTNPDDDDNEFNSALKLINVHLQKVQSLPIVSSADQRLDVILKLSQYLTTMKEDKFILLAASKLELNVACKITMNLLIKSDFIEKMDEQQTLLNSSNLLASLNSLYFIHTILRDICSEIVSCHVQLGQIEERYASERRKLVENFNELENKIETIQMRRRCLLETQQTPEVNIEEELMKAEDDEKKLDETKSRHLTAAKHIEHLYENINTLFLPLRQRLKQFEANGWLQAIRDYSRRRQENLVYELFDDILRIYLKEYDLNQTYSSTNQIDDDRKQLKSDVLRQNVFNKIIFDDIQTPHGRSSLALLQLIYPDLFQQNILLYILKEETFQSTINKCLETGNSVDIIINISLTNFLLVDKRAYNRYSTNDESGVAYLKEQLVFCHYVMDDEGGTITIDKNFLQFIEQFENEVKHRSMNTVIDMQRKYIHTEIDDDTLYFVLPCVLKQQILTDHENLVIDQKHTQQLDQDIQGWIREQRQLGTIRNERQICQNTVENDIQGDIKFFLNIIDQVESIVAQTLTSTDINIRQLAKAVNKTRTELGQQKINKFQEKLDETLQMCIQKEPIARARTLAIVEAKQFRYPVLNQLKSFLADSDTKFHAFISTFIDRVHMIQAKLLQIILRHQSNMNEIELYMKSHQISKLLIAIVKFVMDNIDGYGLKITVQNFNDQIQTFHDEILKHAAHSQFKTIEQLTIDEINDFTLFTKVELDRAIQHVARVEVLPTTRPSIYQPTTVIVKKDAEETMLDRQNEELSKVEKELEQLRQVAKQNGLSRIQYAIVIRKES